MIFGTSRKKKELASRIKTITGVTPKNIQLYETAFVHRNY